MTSTGGNGEREEFDVALVEQMLDSRGLSRSEIDAALPQIAALRSKGAGKAKDTPKWTLVAPEELGINTAEGPTIQRGEVVPVVRESDLLAAEQSLREAREALDVARAVLTNDVHAMSSVSGRLRVLALEVDDPELAADLKADGNLLAAMCPPIRDVLGRLSTPKEET